MATGSRRIRFRGRFLVEGSRGVYHVMSRTACRQHLFDDEAKGQFIRMLRKQAGFSGVDLLAYCVMGNHFHLLVAVPEACELSDEEILRRYRQLYNGAHCPPSAPEPQVLEALLRANEAAGRAWRNRLLARMHNLSAFMRELKQRFGIWYNHRHGNKGTIWSDRFKSLIVEPSEEALSTVAAYIDLNPVRAELVNDPAAYGFSSYGRAVAGDRLARRGYVEVFCQAAPWSKLFLSYNLILYGKGAHAKGVEGKDRGRIDPEIARRVIDSRGRLPLSEVLRLRVRYLSAGAAIGSRGFLEQVAAHLAQKHGLTRKKSAYPMRGGEWGNLRSFRNLQVSPISLN